ncbi:PIR protein [Plasmodium yoelii]|uniref:PIR protein n=2 Tax=Plasmodium yoelii TaxID=5861 RepID=A0AAE9WQD3_PLAYO|nr:PIR protein [Plasmodium yoelii]WBY57096.1 PIR protein [Plasmodium yoelii yoelii]CAC86557.1 putative yir2 protein [Plasmodium yoelii]CDU17795.1 YIR protein [Plasmodium yoelii]VTZ78212.1 PIR protein [Plasmodium yoelii]|eukprot:XP_022812099.1 PIR protein [Plasmodium yoelii]
MDHHRCIRFGTLRVFYPDELENSTGIDFHGNGKIRDYCPIVDSGNKECRTDLDKIKAGFIWLFNQIIVNKINNLNKDQIEIFIIHIMIWFSYMLNIKNVMEFEDINEFYDKYIKNDDEYNKSITNVSDYNSYKEIIDKKKDLLNINFDDISNFYAAFKLLCSMHTDFSANNPNCTEYIEKSNEFVSKYTSLNDDSNNIDGSSYRQVLCTLSNDYDNFKKKCNDVNCMDIPSLPTIKATQVSVNNPEETSLHNSGVTSSSSSIPNTLILVLSIFGVIAFFLGISYKYSLFGFRKRSQRQHLRAKLKNK